MNEVEMKTPDEEARTSEPAEAAPGETGPGEAAPGQESATTEEVSPLAALEAERDKLKDQLLRTAADFDNFRKRSRKDLEATEKRAREDVLRELLPVFDNLERAVGAAGGATDITSIRDGVQMVLRLFEDTAARLGMTRLTTVGERFDPMLHDAIQQRETDEVPPGTIVAEIVPGYRLGDRLVRPAMVVVARKPADAPAS